ncbi:hypothetical protein [Bowdeniella nasicola]|uniref:hypothetical protein n=1 Tax=Bowdeniella nasicola TaxID=208480 RepID=UPI001C9E1E3A|nr:hypothetical protein [Bowdeniella nasicola]
MSPSAQLPSDDDISARFAGVTPRAWGMEMPGIVSRIESDALALTLDACGGARGSGFDAALIDLLRRHQVPATLFLNHR